MPYIGTSPSNGVRRVHTYTATASQTTFTGASSEGVTLSYADTNYIDVFQNGVLLGSADYTSTSGTSVVLAQGASADDLIVIVVYDVFSVADTVSKTSGGSFDSGVTMSSTLDVTGNQTNSGNLTVSGAFTSQGIDDNANATAITINSSEQIGIGTTSPNTGVTVVTGSANGIELGEDSDSSTDSSRLFFSTSSGSNAIHSSSGNMRFFTGSTAGTSTGTERMRLDSSGIVNINCTTQQIVTNERLRLVGKAAFTTSGDAALNLNRDSDNGGTLRFHRGTTQVGDISVTTSSTSYNTSSDHRLKENVVEMTGAIDRVKQLLPKRFNFIADDTNTLVDGFLAHEAQSVVAEAVTGTHNEVDDDNNPVMQGIDQAKLVPLLTGALKEAIAKIETLETRIEALENAE